MSPKARGTSLSDTFVQTSIASQAHSQGSRVRSTDRTSSHRHTPHPVAGGRGSGGRARTTAVVALCVRLCLIRMAVVILSVSSEILEFTS